MSSRKKKPKLRPPRNAELSTALHEFHRKNGGTHTSSKEKRKKQKQERDFRHALSEKDE